MYHERVVVDSRTVIMTNNSAHGFYEALDIETARLHTFVICFILCYILCYIQWSEDPPPWTVAHFAVEEIARLNELLGTMKDGPIVLTQGMRSQGIEGHILVLAVARPLHIWKTVS